METKYLNITNITSQDDLYTLLVDTIQPILDEEQAARAPLEKAFLEFCEGPQAVYDKATEAERNAAKAKIQPEREKLDKKVMQIRARFNALIDKEVLAYEKKQKAVEALYKEVTKDAHAAFDAAIADERKVFEAKVSELGEIANEKIKPINEEYQMIATMFDEREQSKSETAMAVQTLMNE